MKSGASFRWELDTIREHGHVGRVLIVGPLHHTRHTRSVKRDVFAHLGLPEPPALPLVAYQVGEKGRDPLRAGQARLPAPAALPAGAADGRRRGVAPLAPTRTQGAGASNRTSSGSRVLGYSSTIFFLQVLSCRLRACPALAGVSLARDARDVPGNRRAVMNVLTAPAPSARVRSCSLVKNDRDLGFATPCTAKCCVAWTSRRATNTMMRRSRGWFQHHVARPPHVYQRRCARCSASRSGPWTTWAMCNSEPCGKMCRAIRGSQGKRGAP